MHGDSHYRPWEIRRLTEPEIAAALDSDLSERRPPTGSTAFSNDLEEMAWIERLRRETPRERLNRVLEE